MWANQYTCIASCFTAWAACSSWSILRKKKHFPLSVICQINTVLVSPLYLCCWFVISFCDGAKTFICSQEKRIISYNFFLRKKESERDEKQHRRHISALNRWRDGWRCSYQTSSYFLTSFCILTSNSSDAAHSVFMKRPISRSVSHTSGKEMETFPCVFSSVLWCHWSSGTCTKEIKMVWHDGKKTVSLLMFDFIMTQMTWSEPMGGREQEPVKRSTTL